MTHLRVVVLQKLQKDWHHGGQAVALSNDWSHLTKGKGDAGSEGDLRVGKGRLESGEQDVTDLLSTQVLQTLAQRVDSSVLDLGLVVVEQEVKCLDQAVVGDITSKGFRKLGKVLGETKTYLP